MGLFDDIIKDQTATATSPATQSTGGTQQDDSILIIDDAMPTAVENTLAETTSFISLDTQTVAPAAPVETADLIVFDDVPAAPTTPVVTSVEEMSAPVEAKDETFELSSLLAQANEETETKQAPSFFAEETIAAPVVEEKTSSFLSFAEESLSEPVVEAKKEEVTVSSVARPLEDPNAILDASIAQLESLNANHELVKQGKQSDIEAKNNAIADLNKQVAALKKEITGLNKEIDKIDLEKARVNDMIKLFQSQKAA